jgi:hypothetical protein
MNAERMIRYAVGFSICKEYLSNMVVMTKQAFLKRSSKEAL